MPAGQAVGLSCREMPCVSSIAGRGAWCLGWWDGYVQERRTLTALRGAVRSAMADAQLSMIGRACWPLHEAVELDVQRGDDFFDQIERGGILGDPGAQHGDVRRDQERPGAHRVDV